MSKVRDAFRAARPYLAEIGEVGFVAAVTLLVLGTALDHWRPGTFFTYVAPQHVVAACVLFGALALLRDGARERGTFAVLRYWTVAAVLALAVRFVAAAYFAPLGTVGGRLALASAFAVILPFVLFRRFGQDEE